MTPVFDFHARLTPGDGEPAALLAAMDLYGVDRAAVSAGGLLGLHRLSSQIDGGGRSAVSADHGRLLEQCAGSGGRLVPFCLADPLGDAAAYTGDPARFRGLELSPAVHGFGLDDPAVAALVHVAGAAGHPVYVVCLGRPGARTADLVRLARAFPAVTFVWGHCGHTGLDVAGLAEITPVPNVLAETSGCLTATAREAVRRLGAGRVLFGTEYPLQDPGVELAKAAALGLSEPELRAVLWANACRVLGEERT
jgi:predicted TIM-barrel fold metal-dependent hydrolase